MIPKECKRLAEVDFPIAEVSRHSAREKSIRHGHPSTLHLWWARRPLAACRAILMALLLPDPCDGHCPDTFKTDARRILLDHPGRPTKWEKQIADDMGFRKTLLSFIADFANWDHSSDPHYLKTSRALVKAAHPEETPLVVDPFAGGGSIPLEALRLGCEAFASDLNPVACLILKVMLEDIPRHGPELVEDLRRVGMEIKKQAEQELAEFYPADPDGAQPIAYLWARTVKCEAPNCGAEIPLMRSFWLCKKATRKWALRYNVERPIGKPPYVELEIFEPKTEKEVPDGTVTRARAICLCCGTVLPPERVRAHLAVQRGGADAIFDEKGNHSGGARMLAVVTHHKNIQGRNYRLPAERDYHAVWKSQKRLKTILDKWERDGRIGLCPAPDEPTPTKDSHRAVGSQVPLYGITLFADLFAARQKIALMNFVSILNSKSVSRECKDLLAIGIGRVADATASLTQWLASGEEVKHVFSRQALPIVWDYGETNPITDVSRSWNSAINSIANVAAFVASARMAIGQVQQADACQLPLPADAAGVVFTDPPYYDAIPYSDLSNFFLVWLKRSLPGVSWLRDPFDPSNPLSPKDREAVQCEKVKNGEGFPKDRNFYETTMGTAFTECRRVLHEDGIGSVVFAHKTTEGWEALLSGMIKGGWTITGSWPISTEMGSRLNARDTASLATSVHLVCRPRQENAPVGDWADVLQELPGRVGDWMERLQGEGIRGADLVFACIGPALEIFSRYSKVVDPDEVEIPLGGDATAKEPHKRGYLSYVWEVVGRTALEHVLGTAEALARNGAAGAVEEDARLTALFLWTLQSSNGNGEGKREKKKGKSEEIEPDEGIEDEDEEAAPKSTPKGFSLIFDVVRRFAQPLGIILPSWEGRIIETKKGVVRLLSLTERAKILFGAAGAHAVADRIERDREGSPQLSLFPEMEMDTVPRIKGRGKSTDARQGTGVADQALQTKREATTLDRVHVAMLLQSDGRANALRTLLKAEQDRGPDFLRLANALSALYPKGSEEKRLLDAMLLAMPR